MNDKDLFRRAQTYVGRPWRTDFDCADLAALVQFEVFGRSITLPGACRSLRVERDGAAGVAAMRAELAQRVVNPRNGTGVLFSQRISERAQRWHVGTVFIRASRVGGIWILHSNEEHGAQFQPLCELIALGLDLDGYYEWKAAA